jgi:hypothetical protein
MKHAGDWQTWVTLGIGLIALAYLVRRWWPRTPALPSASTCSTPTASHSHRGAGGCGSCQGCGTSVRDHQSSPQGTATQQVQWHPQRRATD